MLPSPDRALWILCLAAAPLVACGGPNRAYAGAGNGGAPGTQAGAGGLDIGGSTSGAGGSEPAKPLVYVIGASMADNSDALWTLDPEHFEAPPVLVGHVGVGTYSSCGDGTTVDIAVDGADRVYSLNAKGPTTVLLQLAHDADPVSCSIVTPLATPLAQRHLSAAPASSSLPAGSVIALDYGGAMYAIDPESGSVQKAGHLSGADIGMQGGGYSSDLVLLDNGEVPIGFVLQAMQPGDGSMGMRLVEIDAAAMGPNDPDVFLADRGELHADPACGADAPEALSPGGGLVAYEDKVYILAASSEGDAMRIYQVDTTDAALCEVAVVPGLLPWGAGISPRAPVIPPAK